jgi:mannosyltransferase
MDITVYGRRVSPREFRGRTAMDTTEHAPARVPVAVPQQRAPTGETVAAPPGGRTPGSAARLASGAAARLAPGVVPGLVMLVVGSVGATRPVLSWDEVSSADVAQRSTAEIWALIQNVDAVLGPYYFLLHAWTRVAGTSVWDLRAPSIFAMAVAVGLAGELGRRLFSPVVGLTAGLVLCLLPNTFRYAAEARPYAFSCLCSVLALLLLHAALRRPRPVAWAVYGVSVVLLGLSHVVALSTLAAHAVAVAWAWRRDGARRAAGVWAITVGAALLLLLPVFLFGTGQRDAQLYWVEPVSPGRLRAGPGQIVGAPETAWLLIGLAVLAAWRRAERLAEMVTLAVVPLAAVAVVSIAAEPLWVPRYMLVVLAPLALLAAVAAVGEGPPGRGRLLRVGLVLLLLAGTAYPAQRAFRTAAAKSGADYRSAAQLVQRAAQPGDAILYEDRQRAVRAGLQYYLSGAPHPPRDVLVSRTGAAAGALVADEYPHPAPQLASVRRVWLVVGGAQREPLARKPRVGPVLRAEFEQAGVWRVRGLTVALYQRPA